MNKFENTLESLKNELFNEPCVKEYFYYKNKVDSDPQIKALDEEVKFHQKEMCKNKDNDEIYLKEKEAYELAKQKFENNPVLINYQIAKEEVFSLLVDIKQLLS